jgi:hypothetical protein
MAGQLSSGPNNLKCVNRPNVGPIPETWFAANRRKCCLVLFRHSHSIVLSLLSLLSHRNALIYRPKFLRRTVKNRLLDTSKIRALDFKAEFRRSEICSVSAAIGTDWSISDIRGD